MDIREWQRLELEAREADRRALHERLDELSVDQNRLMEVLSESHADFRSAVRHLFLIRCATRERDDYHVCSTASSESICRSRPRVGLHFRFSPASDKMERASSGSRDMGNHAFRSDFWPCDWQRWFVSSIRRRLVRHRQSDSLAHRSGKVYKGTWNHVVVALKAFKADHSPIPNQKVTCPIFSRPLPPRA